jgi:hypothetical protein
VWFITAEGENNHYSQIMETNWKTLKKAVKIGYYKTLQKNKIRDFKNISCKCHDTNKQLRSQQKTFTKEQNKKQIIPNQNKHFIQPNLIQSQFLSAPPRSVICIDWSEIDVCLLQKLTKAKLFAAKDVATGEILKLAVYPHATNNATVEQVRELLQEIENEMSSRGKITFVTIIHSDRGNTFRNLDSKAYNLFYRL